MISIIIFCGLLCIASAQTFTLRSLVTPSKAFGGVPFASQPSVAVLDSTGQIALNFVGSCYVQMGSSPSGFEALWIGECDYESCGTVVFGGIAVVPFVNGIAQFSDLMIKTAGTGYTLTYIGQDSQQVPFAFTTSPSFDVLVGPVYMTAFSKFVGTAAGGMPFLPNPVIVAVDKGGNLVSSVNGYTVTAFLSMSPTGKEKLKPEHLLTVQFFNGIATFQQLYINESGSPYQVAFSSNMPINGFILKTLAFAVRVGLPAKLSFQPGTEISNATVYAGEFFSVTPSVILRDIGGNIVETDSSSAIVASIYENPSGARLGLKENLFVSADRGYARFTALVLDKVGRGYRLKFVLSEYDPLRNTFTETSIALFSEKFDVVYGPPRSLSNKVYVDRAWAGGQPFKVQPVLQLLDYGGNVVATDFSSVATASLIPSLQVGYQIKVDTSGSINIINFVNSVTVDVDSGNYGAGDVIVFTVGFAYEMWMDDSAATGTPYLEMNAQSSGSAARAYLVSEVVQTTTMQFLYNISEGESSADLDYVQSGGIRMAGNVLRDGNGRLYASMQMPSVTGQYNFVSRTKAIVVDTAAPVIEMLTTDKADGEYGAGEEFLFFVTFNLPVSVVGTPSLTLNVYELTNSPTASPTRVPTRNPTASPTRTPTRNPTRSPTLPGGTSSPTAEPTPAPTPTPTRTPTPAPTTHSPTPAPTVVSQLYEDALFAYLTDSGRTLVFRYTVPDGVQTVSQLAFKEKSIYIPSGARIQRYSDLPTTDVNASFAHLVTEFAANHSISIDTTPPQLNTTFGVQSDHASGVYYPGEKFLFYVQFTKPVVAKGASINLFIATGASFNGIALITGVLSDNVTVEFQYITTLSVNIAKLDIISGSNALFMPGTDENYIRRLSTNPTTNVLTDTSPLYNSGNTLRSTHNITIRNAIPVVSSVNLVSLSMQVSGSTLYPGDIATISVVFTTPVMSVCSPVLLIDVSSTTDTMAYREAVYIGGNATNTLFFNYTVQIGDSNTALSYRYTPNALCLESGCPADSTCVLYAVATESSLVAQYVLPLAGGGLAVGKPVANYAINPNPVNRRTTVIQAYSTSGDEEIGAGTFVTFNVEFSDEVKFASGFTNITLFLSVGRYAQYGGGAGTKVLLFTYMTTIYDTTDDLKPAVIPNSGTALRCLVSEQCTLVNMVNQAVNMTMSEPLGNILANNLKVDVSAPRIVDVYTNKVTSPYDGVYTVGEEFYIVVQFDKPVYISAKAPQLRMALQASTPRYAEYQTLLSNVTHLVFYLRIQQGDFTRNLTYDGADAFHYWSALYRASTTPVTEANYTMPMPVSAISRNGQSLVVDTLIYPKVTEVVSLSPSKRYAPGDRIQLKVTFSKYVVADGLSYLALRVGDHVAKANFTGTEVTGNAAFFKMPTRTFYYEYLVGEGDFNNNLDYVDSFSLIKGVNEVNDPTTILAASTVPTQVADLTLPRPTYPGSLSGPNATVLYIDGFAPYMTDLKFGTFPKQSISVGANVDILMTFSVPVTVTGAPYLLLTTKDDNTTRPAVYRGGSGTTKLTFRYTVQPGDMTSALDYYGDRERSGSASNSFSLNGGSILATSETPTAPAYIRLSPAGGVLGGSVNLQAIAGTFTFLDLVVPTKGPDYLLRFSSSPTAAYRTITTTQPLFVSFSNEFELRPKVALPRHNIGHSTDIHGDIAVLGAPFSNRSITTIQTVTTEAKKGPPIQEVMLIGLQPRVQPAIISFYTTADVGVEVKGSFTLKYGSHATSRLLDANVEGSMLMAIFSVDLPIMGNVTITREPYVFCACENAYVWTMTFNDVVSGDLPEIILDGSGLYPGDQVSYEGLGIVGPIVVQSPSRLAGTFALHSSLTGKTTSDIPVNAGTLEIRAAILELDLDPIGIVQYQPIKSGAQRWEVTFGAYNHSYEIPELEIITTNLEGANRIDQFVRITRKGQHGPTGINGWFALTFRGNTTYPIPYDATAEEMKEALEDLDTINFVNVNRTLVNDNNCFQWVIDFVEVRHNTPRGYVTDVTLNVEPLIPHNHLIGTETNIVVGSRYLFGQEARLEDKSRAGTYGNFSGRAYVYQRIGEQAWTEVAVVTGNDTDENDNFGYDVSVSGDWLLVGATGADMTGVLEQQAISCNASDGYFTVSFRGWTSAPISHSVTKIEFETLINANPATLYQSLTPIVRADVAAWSNDSSEPLCANHTAIITFYAPVDDPTATATSNRHSNLELLTLDATQLEGNITIWEKRAGDIVPHGSKSNTRQQGAAYLFHAKYECSPLDPICLKSSWVQVAQFFPSNSVGGERFGHSVAISGIHAVVGAPGSLNEAGVVYVYKYGSTSQTWSLLQSISLFEVQRGYNFGHAVAVERNTLIVAAPFADNSTGIVYVFKQRSTDAFGLSQRLYPPVPQEDMQFGFSVALEGDTLVIGASQFNDADAIYYGVSSSPRQNAHHTGAVFVYKRADANSTFIYYQKLLPTNVRDFDRFGFSVDIHSDTIVVGAVEDFDESKLTAFAPIVEVKTSAKYGGKRLGSNFRLRWFVENATFVVPTSPFRSVYHAPLVSDFELPTLANVGGPGMVWRSSRDIPHDVTAAVLKTILEEDLGTGNVLVSRSAVDQYNGGYTWTVTFVDFLSDGSQLDLFSPDFSTLTGTDAVVTVRFINPTPPRLRGMTHIFQPDLNNQNKYTEQVFLSPYSDQPIDRCGYSVAIFGYYALVGCPNRDIAISNMNSGAGIVFYLSLLTLQFSANSYDVQENAGNVTLTVDRFQSFPFDVFFYVQSLDRNADYLTQLFLHQLYGVRNPQNYFPKTIADIVSVVGTAIARTQYYGSTHNESLWADGMYDYRGLSDYVPIKYPEAFLVEYETLMDLMIINPDTLLEFPDENISVIINAPGIWPSPLGRLFSVVNIEESVPDGVIEQTDGNSLEVYAKIYDSDMEAGGHFGDVVVVDSTMNVMATSSPRASVDNIVECGKVQLSYRRVSSNSTTPGPWEQGSLLTSPLLTVHSTYNHFGESLAMTRLYNREIGFIVVGEPIQNAVHVYKSTSWPPENNWAFDTTLQIPGVNLPQHKFGAAGTIGIDGYLLAVGAPGLETVYLFLYGYNSTLLAWQWEFHKELRSSDYDYDVIQDVVFVHRQFFGQSVAVSGRTVAVGSPFADYDKLGSDLVEINWETEGTDIFGTSRGRVYIFDSYAAVQKISLRVQLQLVAGNFKLQYNHQGMIQNTSLIPFDCTLAEMKDLLESLDNIDEVTVSTSTINNGIAGFIYTWTVTFNADLVQPGDLLPLWYGYGCYDCEPFDQTWTADPDNQVLVEHLRGTEDIVEYQKVFASDRRQGDRFGATIAMDGEQLVVGATHSAAMTTTTWDFESGSLQGWSITGTAFDFQPTFGDNSKFRSGYRMLTTSKTSTIGTNINAESSNIEGSYYVGTFEKRPGSRVDYSTFNESFSQGTTQGDTPVGTMTSQVFMIRGDTISFLIGGGCNIYSVYVSLLVDGMEVARATGKCKESMERVVFDVAPYIHRAGQIRVVDSSRSNWGHVNVDAFQFSWDVRGAIVNGTSDTTNRPVYGGQAETPLCGAVYVFRRHIVNTDDFCDGVDHLDCMWSEETKLIASDKRSYDAFGASLAVDDNSGIIIVGAPNAKNTGFYKETPTVYPYANLEQGVDLITGVTLPISMHLFEYFLNLPAYSRQATATKAMAILGVVEGVSVDSAANSKEGAVYVYVRDPAVLALGHVVVKPHWYYTETMKLQPSDGFGQDNYGTSVSLSGRYLAVGSPGNDGLQPDSGATYFYDAGFASISFAATQFVAIEGTDSYASVSINRNTAVFAGEITLEYATSDLTAIGVDAIKYEECLSLPTGQRSPSGCNHYQQTSGLVTIAAGSSSGGFTVNIMNDLCRQPFFRFIQVTLSVPGSGALQGQKIQAQIRIDDDDFLQDLC